MKSLAEKAFAAAWERNPLPGVVLAREFRFHPTRRWRFDFAFPEHRLAIELDGMGRGRKKGGHQTAVGMRNDREKANAAVLRGWRVLRFLSADRANACAWVSMVHEAIGLRIRGLESTGVLSLAATSAAAPFVLRAVADPSLWK